MTELSLPAQYYRMYDEARPYGCRETDYHHVHVTLPLPLDATALVLVDFWNMLYCQSWIERADGIVRSACVPVLESARQLGMTIIHAPSPPVAAKYPQARHDARAGEAPEPITYGVRDAAWPPAAFADREGDYAGFRRDAAIPACYWEEPYQAMRIHPLAEPLYGEFVIATGPQMHRLLAARKILHLVYMGFAANMCIQYRDYGVRAFSQRGYNTIFLRDCTTAVEYHDTVADLTATHIAIREVEYFYGYTALGMDFSACAHAVHGAP